MPAKIDGDPSAANELDSSRGEVGDAKELATEGAENRQTCSLKEFVEHVDNVHYQKGFEFSAIDNKIAKLYKYEAQDSVYEGFTVIFAHEEEVKEENNDRMERINELL